MTKLTDCEDLYLQTLVGPASKHHPVYTASPMLCNQEPAGQIRPSSGAQNRITTTQTGLVWRIIFQN